MGKEIDFKKKAEEWIEKEVEESSMTKEIYRYNFSPEIQFVKDFARWLEEVKEDDEE